VRVVIFAHSLVSDWNHGNAHFLRGIAGELLSRGDDVRVLEPHDSWSRAGLMRDGGEAAVTAFEAAFPRLRSERYDLASLDVDEAVDGADVVMVHEWNDHELVRRIGGRRASGGRFALLFHDTHHRSVSDPAAMGAYDLRDYDGVLAFGETVRRVYLERGWAHRAWTWHEAADTRVFGPLEGVERDPSLVWVGNWGDDERTAELEEFLLGPVRALGLRGTAHGVRFPPEGVRAFAAAGLRPGGWLANHRVPEVFARHAVTVHIPRRPYVEVLPGIPPSGSSRRSPVPSRSSAPRGRTRRDCSGRATT
jgi:spore maturation protein CgeB